MKHTLQRQETFTEVISSVQRQHGDGNLENIRMPLHPNEIN